jgi:hypothetical protein
VVVDRRSLPPLSAPSASGVPARSSPLFTYHVALNQVSGGMITPFHLLYLPYNINPNRRRPAKDHGLPGSIRGRGFGDMQGVSEPPALFAANLIRFGVESAPMNCPGQNTTVLRLSLCPLRSFQHGIEGHVTVSQLLQELTNDFR